MDVNGLYSGDEGGDAIQAIISEFVPREAFYRLSTGSQVMSTPSFLNIFWSTSLSITVQ